MDDELIIRIKGEDQSRPVFDSAAEGARNVGTAAEGAKGGVGGLFDSLGSLAGGALLGGIAALGGAVIGIGASAFSVASDLNAATNQIQAQLGATADEAEALGDVALAVFGSNFGGSLPEVGAAIADVEQRLGLMGTEGAAALQQATESAFALRDVFGLEIPESTAAAQTLMNEFGLTSQQALDFVAKGMQEGLNSSGDFLDTIGEYSNLFADGGASAAQFFSMLETGLAGGALGTDKAADAFKEFGIRILDGSKTTADAMQQLGLGEVLAGVEDGSVTAVSAFDAVQGALARVEDPAAQAQLGVALLGTQFEDLGPSAVLGINTAQTSLADLDGAADSLNVKYNDIGSLFGAMGREAQVALLPLGQTLLDLANGAMPSVQAAFQAAQPMVAAFAQGLAQFATGAAPIVGAALSTLGGIMQQVGSAILPALAAAWQALQPAIQAAGQVLAAIAPLFANLASQAVSWGANIVNQLAGGITQAASVVVSALAQIGAVITSWLKPGSPPKLLPDLTDWGAGAATAYMDGWAAADFAALTDLGGEIRGVLEGLVDTGAIEQVDLVPLLLGGREALGNALNELRQFGTVSEDTFQQVITAVGPAGPAVEGLLASYFDLASATMALEAAQADLASAQADLNAITAEYAGILDPLSATLDANKARQQEIRDMQRIEKLQEDLASGKLDAQEAELAQLQIAEIQQRQQISAVEDERDVALEAAQAKVDGAKAAVDAAAEGQAAAQAQLENQRAAIDAQAQQNDLLTEQRDLLAELAEQAAAAAAASSAGGGGGGGLPALEMPDMADVGSQFEDLTQPLADVAQVVDDVRVAVEPAAALFSAFGDAAGSAAETIASTVGQFSTATSAATSFTDVFGTITAKVGEVGAQVIGQIGAALPGIIATLGGWALGFAQWVVEAGPPMLASLGSMIATLLEAIGAALPGLVESLATWGAAFFQWAVDAAPPLFAQLLGLVGQLIAYIISNAPGIAAQLGQWAMAFIAWVGPAAGQLIGALGEMAGELFAFIVEQGPTIKSTIEEWGDQLYLWVGTVALPGVLSALGEFVSGVFGEIGKAAGSVGEKAGAIGKNLVAGIVQGLQNAAGSLYNAIKGLITGATGAAESQADISSPSGLFADRIGEPIAQGIAMGIMAGLPEAAAAAAAAANETLAAAQDALAIGSPSLRFAEDVGSPITEGMAQGILDNLDVLLDAGQEIGGTILEEAIVWADQIRQAVAPLIEAGFSGMAEFARAQMGASNMLDALANGGAAAKAVEQATNALGKLDTQLDKLRKESGGSGEAVKKQEAELVKLARERARLEITARQNADPEKRAAAQEKLLELADKEAEIQAEIAEKKAEAAQKTEERLGKIAELEAERLTIEQQQARALTAQERQRAIATEATEELNAALAQAQQIQDPAESAAFYALRAKQIEEEAKLKSQLALVDTDQERARLDQQLKLLEIAQQNEFQVYAAQADARRRDREDQLREAQLLSEQLGNLIYYSQEDVFGQGQDLILGIRDGMQSQLGTLRGTLGDIMQQVIDQARADLGIASPSKVSGVKIGLPFIEGISTAVEGGAAELRAAAALSVGALADVSLPPIPTPTLAPQDVQAGGRGAQSVTNLTIDLRGNTTMRPEETEAAIKRALGETGRTADIRIRMG